MKKGIDGIASNTKKYRAINKLSATVAEAIISLGTLKASDRATKFTPPPIYDPVIIAATYPKSGTYLCKAKYPINAPNVVPNEPIIKIPSNLPLSFHIFFMLQLKRSIGIAKGII
ncbi:hypothetical protein SDC9_190450 [bioreactor metagenome]|uniref:Uncharacterized protein n=1 Tax=bioreactor metagenome TaxID=1076179 RepID=A0A645HWP3_9ZZZZ